MTIEQQIELMNRISTDENLNNREMETCTILKVNNDNTCNCRVTGYTYAIIQARILNGVQITEGDTGILAYPFADKNIPYVIGRSDLSWPDEEEIGIRDIPPEVGGLCIIHYYDEKFYIYDNSLTETSDFSFLESSDSELTYMGRDLDGNFYLKDENSSFDLVKYNRDFSVRTEI